MSTTDSRILDSTEEILDSLDSESLEGNGYPATRDSLSVRQRIDEKAMTADFIIVTSKTDINRNGHRVQITSGDGGKGLLLNNFKRNPVVFFDHAQTGLSLPIARSSVPELFDNRATATAEFSQSLPEAMQIFALIAEGILGTASIGFMPLKARYFIPKQESTGEDEVQFRNGRALHFMSNDLLEWSVVGVPADPGAVRRSLDLGKIGGEKITQSVRNALSKHAGENPVQGVGFDQADLLTQQVNQLAVAGIGNAEEIKELIDKVSNCTESIESVVEIQKQLMATENPETLTEKINQQKNKITQVIDDAVKAGINDVKVKQESLSVKLDQMVGKTI